MESKIELNRLLQICWITRFHLVRIIKKSSVEIYKGDNEKKTILKVIDEGKGFKEKNTNKIFNRFYSNRPDNFGEHSGLGLNIVKNLVESAWCYNSCV